MTEIQTLVKRVEKPPQRVPQGGSREQGNTTEQREEASVYLWVLLPTIWQSPTT